MVKCILALYKMYFFIGYGLHLLRKSRIFTAIWTFFLHYSMLSCISYSFFSPTWWKTAIWTFLLYYFHLTVYRYRFLCPFGHFFYTIQCYRVFPSVFFDYDKMKNSHLDIFAVLFPCYRVLLQLVFFQVTFFSVKFASVVFFVKLWHSKISFRRVCPC